MYDAFVQAYDELFPVHRATLDFLAGIVAPPAATLDIGCASGGHAIALVKRGYACTGIDPSRPLIDAARSRAEGIPIPPEFLEGGSGDLAALFTDRRFRLMLCLGNTLPHLESLADVDSFLVDCARFLEPGGAIVIQLLNYSVLLRDKPASLPMIEVGRWRFERHYDYLAGAIAFSTILTELRTGAASFGSTRLLPVRPAVLEAVMEKAGLRVETIVSSWKGETFMDESSALVIAVGRKDD